MEIDKQNVLLQEKINLLIQENNQLKKKISSLQELLGSEICRFFEICSSINKTKKRFCYETISECYHDLIYFYGSSDPLKNAEDFKECYHENFGKVYTSYEEYTSDEDDDTENLF